MLLIDKDTMTIHLTRGDHAILDITSEGDDGAIHKFQPGDVINLRVMERIDYKKVVLQKEIVITEETEVAVMELTSKETKIGDVRNKPFKYDYEIELNKDGEAHTIVGNDKTGPKLFIVYPEGGEYVNS